MRKEMRLLAQGRVIFVACVLGLAFSGWALQAGAEPKGPNGEKCDSSETGVTHAINGKNYTCDKCVYLKCDASGGSISNCQKVTHWSNCVAQAVRPGGQVAPMAGGTLQNAPVTNPPPKTGVVTPPSSGTLQRK